jgi:hypothetical protein
MPLLSISKKYGTLPSVLRMVQSVLSFGLESEKYRERTGRVMGNTFAYSPSRASSFAFP